MIIKYLTILIVLHLSGITCIRTNIAKLLPSYGSNMDIMVSEFSRIVTAIEINRFSQGSFIKIILPTEDDNTILPQIMEKATQKLASSWLVSTNDSFCCNSYEIKILLNIKPTIVERTPSLYIVPLRQHNGLEYLDAQLNLLSQENSFNPRAIFLLVTLTSQCSNYEDNKVNSLYFNQMWGKNCMSSVILVLSECDFKITMLMAAPFTDNNMCRKVHENGTKQYKYKWSEEDIHVSVHKTDHRNFNKCTFLVGTFLSPPFVVGKPYTHDNETQYEFVGGIDLELLNLASIIYNFTYVFDVQHGYNPDAMSKVWPNFTITGIFVDILKNDLDIAVGGIMPHHYAYHRYDYSAHYKFSSLDWVVSDASVAPQWKIFFGAFSTDVWIVSGFVFLVTSFLYSFLDNFLTSFIGENCHSFIEKMSLCLNIQTMPLIQYFSITLGLTSMIQPKSPSLRIVFFSWSIYSFHMCIAYTSMLFLLMSNPPLDKEIKTVEDLARSDLKMGLQSVMLQRFESKDLDSTTRDIMDNSFVCPLGNSCVKDFIKHRNYSLLVLKDNFEYYVNMKQSKVHRISEAFFSYSASFMMRKGNPLGPGLDKIILIAFQSGLFEKWDRDTKSNSISLTNGFTGFEKSATTLTLSDLKETFFVLASGIFLSSLLLCGELCVSFLKIRESHDKQTSIDELGSKSASP